MIATDKHMLQYRQQGYCLIRGLIPAAVVEAASSRSLEVFANAPDWPSRHFQVLDPQRYSGEQGRALPAGIQRPASRERVFHLMATHPRLVQAMSELLGGPVEFFTDQIGVKYGAIVEAQGGCSYFHQDSYYWHIDPQLGCNCWLPLTAVGPQAIALAVVPGSHRGWVLEEHESYFDDPPMGHINDGFKPFQRHRIPPHRAASEAEVLVEMEPGDGLFFTNYTWHRSEPNRSGQTKAFYAIAYQLAAAKAGESGA